MDGLTIGRERIAREAAGKTGFLDLGRIGLTELPDELFQLNRLRRQERYSAIAAELLCDGVILEGFRPRASAV